VLGPAGQSLELQAGTSGARGLSEGATEEEGSNSSTAILRGWTGLHGSPSSSPNATTTYNKLLDSKARKRGALMASGVVWARNQVSAPLSCSLL
jgi:hypothetical protein